MPHDAQFFAFTRDGSILPGPASLYGSTSGAADCTLNAAVTPGQIYSVALDVDGWMRVAGGSAATQYQDQPLFAKVAYIVQFASEDCLPSNVPTPHFYLSAAGHVVATPLYLGNFQPRIATIGLAETGVAVDAATFAISGIQVWTATLAEAQASADAYNSAA